jgi:hypothetical protein
MNFDSLKLNLDQNSNISQKFDSNQNQQKCTWTVRFVKGVESPSSPDREPTLPSKVSTCFLLIKHDLRKKKRFETVLERTFRKVKKVPNAQWSFARERRGDS